MNDDVRRFYDELASEYDAIYHDWDATVLREGALLDRLLGEAADPILDVAAGMGTQALGLALRGHRVVARDLSPALVRRGQREAARLGAAVTFDVGNMCETQDADAGRFGSVIACGNALPHLDDTELGRALQAAWHALRPGGRFLAAIRDYDALAQKRPALEPARLMGAAPKRRLALQVWDWHDDGQICEVQLIVMHETTTGWTVSTHRTRYRALRRTDLERAARAAGLVAPTWEIDASSASQLIFMAQRPADR